MDILFALVGLVMLLAMCAGAVILVIFMARKIGLLRPSVANAENAKSTDSGLNSYFGDVNWLNNTMLWRFALVAVLIAIMTVPLSMVNDLSLIHI